MNSYDTAEPWIVQPQKESDMMMKVADEKARIGWDKMG